MQKCRRCGVRFSALEALGLADDPDDEPEAAPEAPEERDGAADVSYDPKDWDTWTRSNAPIGNVPIGLAVSACVATLDELGSRDVQCVMALLRERYAEMQT